jgi:hypothetical protein
MNYLAFLEEGAQDNGQSKDALLSSATELIQSDWVQATKDKREPSFNKLLFATLPVAHKLDAHLQVINELEDDLRIGN